jgi:hypothetical protein
MHARLHDSRRQASLRDDPQVAEIKDSGCNYLGPIKDNLMKLIESRAFGSFCATAIYVCVGATSALAQVITFDDVISGQTAYRFDSDGDSRADFLFSTPDSFGFNTVGPGPNMSYIKEPGLEGTSLLSTDLRVDFVSGANRSVKFDFALNSESQNGTVTVDVYNANNRLLATKTVQGLFTSTFQGTSSFPEGQVNVAFNENAAYAKLNFTSDYGRYILDNFQVPKPNVYGLFVGVKDRGVAGDIDAQKMFNTLSTSIPGFMEGRVLTADITSGGEITGQQIQQAINEMAPKMKAGDTFIFFNSSHGSRFGEGSETTLTPGDEFLAVGNAVTDDSLTSFLGVLNGIQKWIFLDSCYSGGFWGNGNRNDSGDLEKLGNIGLFAGSGENSLSYSLPLTAEGYFTATLLAGFSVGVDSFLVADKDKNRELTFDEMKLWIESDKQLQDRQDPEFLFERAQGDIVPFSRDLFTPMYAASNDFEGRFFGGAAGVAGPVPEPSTIALVLGGLFAIGGYRMRIAMHASKVRVGGLESELQVLAPKDC